jgi:hypothetical protein
MTATSPFLGKDRFWKQETALLCSASSFKGTLVHLSWVLARLREREKKKKKEICTRLVGGSGASEIFPVGHLLTVVFLK